MFLFFVVRMHKCLGQHSCMRSTFSIFIMNGTCFFRSPEIDFVLVRSAIKLNNIII